MMNKAFNTNSQETTSSNDDHVWQKLKTLQNKFDSLSKRIDKDIEAEKAMRKLFPQTRKDMEKLTKLAQEIMELRHLAPMINDSPPSNDVIQQQRVETDREDENKQVQLKQYIAKAG